VNGWRWRRTALRWLSLFGIVVPALDSLANTVVGLHRPKYNFLLDYISDLGARGRPDSDALCAVWVTFPLLFAPFVIAVYEGLQEHRFGWVVPALLEFFALFLGLCGIFRFDPAGPYTTFASQVHVLATGLAGTAVFPGPFVLWLATRHDPRWQGVRRFSLLLQAGGAVTAVLFALVHFHVLWWAGLIERGFWGVYYVWFVALALQLRRLGRTGSEQSNGSAGAAPHLEGTGAATSRAGA
jgi:hypothetical membrane protein